VRLRLVFQEQGFAQYGVSMQPYNCRIRPDADQRYLPKGKKKKARHSAKRRSSHGGLGFCGSDAMRHCSVLHGDSLAVRSLVGHPSAESQATSVAAHGMVAFLHIPKTGGSSIKHVFGRWLSKHADGAGSLYQSHVPRRRLTAPCENRRREPQHGGHVQSAE